MLALTAALILIPLLGLPGALVRRAALGAHQAGDALDRAYTAAIIGVLLNGWLALLLAELGLFRIWLHILLIGGVCLIAAVVAARRRALPNTPLGIIAPSAFAAPRPGLRAVLRTHWQTLAYAAVLLLFALLVARPFEVVLGVRDAGVYANTGFAIARSGSLIQPDPLVAQIVQDQESADPALRAAALQAETNFLGVQNKERFIATRMRVPGFMFNEGDLAAGRITPQFYHLFPVWIALLAALLGNQGGLLATGLLGLFGVWGVGMLGRRLAGPWVGLLAAALLALNGVQVWFSRYSTSEVAAQAVVFAGLYCFAAAKVQPNVQRPAPHVSASLPSSEHALSDAQRATLNSRLAFFSGLAFGQVLLVRIDALFLVAPLILAYLGWRWIARRWDRADSALGIGFGLMALHAGVHALVFARAYFFDTGFARLQDQSAIIARLTLPFLTDTLRSVYLTTNRSILRQTWRLPAEIGVVLAGVLVLVLIRRDGRLPALVARLAARARPWLLGGAALLLVLLAAYAYLIRPHVLTASTLIALPGCLQGPQLRAPAGACLALQSYIGAPIPLPANVKPTLAIPLANFVRFGWYLSPLGIALGVLGAALWLRRSRDPAAWLFFALAALSTFFWIRQSYGTSEQTYIYILRRYVPLAYPAFCLGAAYAICALAAAPRLRRPAAPQPHRLVVPRFRDSAAPPSRGSAVPRFRGSAVPWFRGSVVPWSRSPTVSRFCGSVVPWLRGAAAIILAIALLSFEALTSRAIYAHTEYGGALDQIGAVAARFQPNDVVLLRGGAPSYGEARDIPDLIATPLRFAFGINAFTIKGPTPGSYAADLAAYVRRWQSQGRNVYLLLGASGGLTLPGLRAEPLDRVSLSLREFEALTAQKPTNVQTFALDFVRYQLVPAPPQTATTVTPADYSAQLRGLDRPETYAGSAFAWTNGDAQLRLVWPTTSTQLTLTLAAGKRPASIGPANACVSYRPEQDLAASSTRDADFTPLGCFTLTEQPAVYTVNFDPRTVPAPPTGSYILRITSATWVPANVPTTPPATDQRTLGVLFGGLAVR